MLDTFAHTHSHCKIKKEIFDTKNQFTHLPQNFQNPNYIATYIITGHPFTKKYKIQNNKPTIKKFNNELNVIATLCLKPIANTSLQEIKTAIELLNRPVQGWNQTSLNQIIEKLSRIYSKFNPENDSAFFFAGEKETSIQKAELHQIWLYQFLSSGSDSLKQMSKKEAELFKNIFPQEILAGNKEAIIENSYKLKNGKYLSHTSQFLKRKLKLYNQKK